MATFFVVPVPICRAGARRRGVDRTFAACYRFPILRFFARRPHAADGHRRASGLPSKPGYRSCGALQCRLQAGRRREGRTDADVSRETTGSRAIENCRHNCSSLSRSTLRSVHAPEPARHAAFWRPLRDFNYSRHFHAVPGLWAHECPDPANPPAARSVCFPATPEPRRQNAASAGRSDSKRDAGRPGPQPCFT
jgi:hypothetical protein